MTVAETDRSAAPETAPGADQAFFRCDDVHAFYGDSYVVQGISFTVREGSVVALLGRNGAGKTSTLRAIARGAHPQLRRGQIWLAGRPLHRMDAYKAARAGVQLVPEDRRIIPGVTVEENLILAQIAEPRGWEIDRIYAHFPRLADRRRQEATTLSGGEQQMLAVARAVARDLKLLLLDEPFEGLAPQIVREIEAIVAEVKNLGITTIIVEQNAIAALELADRAVILDMGTVAFDGAAREVLESKALRDEYLAI
jgi:branched-chain amino acid transport system ATP-binding protein